MKKFKGKFYIAAPFFNEDELKVVKLIEKHLDTLGIEYFSPRSFGVIKDMSPEEKSARLNEVYEMNIEQVKECTYMIAVTDGYDAGTMFEVGYAIANRDKINTAMKGLKLTDEERNRFTRAVITFSAKNKKVNVMLRQSVDSHVSNEKDLLAMLVSLAETGNLTEVLAFPDEVE